MFQSGFMETELMWLWLKKIPTEYQVMKSILEQVVMHNMVLRPKCNQRKWHYMLAKSVTIAIGEDIKSSAWFI